MTTAKKIKKPRAKGIVVPLAIVKRYQKAKDSARCDQTSSSSEIDRAADYVRDEAEVLADKVLKYFKRSAHSK